MGREDAGEPKDCKYVVDDCYLCQGVLLSQEGEGRGKLRGRWERCSRGEESELDEAPYPVGCSHGTSPIERVLIAQSLVGLLVVLLAEKVVEVIGLVALIYAK